MEVQVSLDFNLLNVFDFHHHLFHEWVINLPLFSLNKKTGWPIQGCHACVDMEALASAAIDVVGEVDHDVVTPDGKCMCSPHDVWKT